MKFTDVSEYLQFTDLDGNVPKWRMFVSNRTAGKTTSALKLLLLRRLKENKEFVILYRSEKELTKSSIQFLDVVEIFSEFSSILKIEDKPLAGGRIREYIATVKSNEEEISRITLGYCTALKNADAIKKYSAVFRKCYTILMDEFQLENGRYLPDEVGLFESVYKTISRGGGEMSRPVEVFLLSNDVSLINPYFLHFKIPQRLKPGTKKLRGNGWILFYIFNEDAAKAMLENAGNKVFESTKYNKYSCGLTQLFSCNSFIEAIPQKTKYLYTIEYRGKKYGVRIAAGKYDLMHISHKIDTTCLTTLVFEEAESDVNKFVIRRHSNLWKTLRTMYDSNSIRFADMECKNMLFDLLGIEVLG